MGKVTKAPLIYAQGAGELERLREYAAIFTGGAVYAVVDGFILDRYEAKINKSFKNESPSLHMLRFSGECTSDEIDRVIKKASQASSGMIIGIGGGKTLDTAKAAAQALKRPNIAVPTSAANNAACSTLVSVYDSKGVFSKNIKVDCPPQAVVCDLAVLIDAPIRLLSAGMGDALSAYYETRACVTSRAPNVAGGTASQAACAFAAACRDNLFSQGYKALLAAETHTLNAALSDIVETNLYLSGIAAESGGIAAAHALAGALTILPEVHNMLHGELVAFCTIVQLLLETAADDEIFSVVDFCRTIGLPINLSMLGAKNVSMERWKQVASLSCSPDSGMQNMPFTVTPQEVLSAILVADKIGS